MDVDRVGGNAAVEATEEILDCFSTRLRKGEYIGQEVIRHFNVIIKFRLGLLTVIVNQSFPQHPESQSLVSGMSSSPRKTMQQSLVLP